MKKYGLMILIALLAASSMQCSKRDNPLDPEVSHGLYWSLYFESSAIGDNVMDNYPSRHILVYTPPGYDPADTLIPGDPNSPGTYYPVLYLLHGYGGDHTYFKGLFDVGSIMDELISTGEIEPMIIVTPNATNNLGGSFYTNSPDFGTGQSYAGRMQDFITEEVVAIIDSVYNTVADRAHRGVAGHSMGGYGAIKLAMLRNDMFGSASVMSAPLMFQPRGLTDTTLMALMPGVWQENGFAPGDTAAFYRITPGTGKRLTNMMFALAVSFSPHNPVDPDTSFAHRFAALGFVGYADLPFDVNGQVAPSVWAYWLANDIATIYDSMYTVFDNTPLYVDCGQVDQLLFQGQASAFYRVASASIDEFEIYPSIDDLYAADHTTLIAERLRRVLSFHDNAFGGQ